MKDDEITLKEVYRKVIELETKFDLTRGQYMGNVRKFRLYVFLILLLEVIMILIHVWGLFYE